MSKRRMKLIRFDWAIKKLLRHKANFDILEGFLSVLLSEAIVIKQILDSESNKETENDKHNRVAILVENSTGELIIIEIQNSKEYDYFHRILFGTSKIITEHIKQGEPYALVRKVISITIAYFDLGQGEDYVYHGTNSFKGIHKGDILSLAKRQKEVYKKEEVYQIFPEYWLLKVQNFDDTIVQDKLDEWIYFLKNGEVEEGFTAKGLSEAKERLDEMKLSQEERLAYKKYLVELREIASRNHTKDVDAKELIEKGIKQGIEQGIEKGIEQGEKKQIIKTVLNLHELGLPNDKIAKGAGISIVEVEKILKEDIQ
jgi:predicted transposase/invertase (TIGR01784 family)